MPELTTRQSVKKVPPRKRERGNDVDVRWWRLEGEDAAKSVFEVVRSIENATKTRRELFEKYACQYLDLRATKSSTTTSLLSRLTPTTTRAKRCSTNVTQSCVDTAGAHISKNRPRPIFLTSGGDLALRTQARKLTRYMDGLLALVKIHKTGQAVAADSRIFGTGIGYFYVKTYEGLDDEGNTKVVDGEICVERVLVDELRVDDDEARYGQPRQIHRVRLMTRDELIEIFPEHEKDILDAQPARETRVEADLVEVIESWHLPTGRVRYKKGADGKEDRSRPITDGCFKTTLCGDVELQSAPYTKDYFPFLPLHWSEPLAGFWGRGLCEELAGKQKTINDYDADIAEALKLSAKIKWLVPVGTTIDPNGISDVVAEQVPYEGPTPPTPIVPPAVAPELYQHRQRTIQECYEMTGVSQSQATATKEQGLDSGVAIREQNDINSTRFVLKAQAYEQWYMDASNILIDLSRDLYDLYKVDLTVKGRAGKFIESIKWSDVNLENDAYDMQTFPVSLLPTTPQGRLQYVQEMMDRGLVTPEQGKRLLDFPDIEEWQETSLDVACYEYAASIVADLLEGDDYEAPDWRSDLTVVMNVALANYLRALRMKVPEHILENLRQLMDECELVLGAQKAGVDMRNQQAFNAYLKGVAANQNAAPAPPVDPALLDPALAGPVDPALMDPTGGAMPPAEPPPPPMAVGA